MLYSSTHIASVGIKGLKCTNYAHLSMYAIAPATVLHLQYSREI